MYPASETTTITPNISSLPRKRGYQETHSDYTGPRTHCLPLYLDPHVTGITLCPYCPFHFATVPETGIGRTLGSNSKVPPLSIPGVRFL